MSKELAESLELELNDLLEAYEQARAREEVVDLNECLPGRDHPLYLEARRELVRVDLEYGWLGGRPKRLADYLALFPDLFDDPASARDIAFEEYRLRVLAGENPSAADYERRYRVSAADWPGSDVDIDNYAATVVTDPQNPDELATVRNHVKTPPLEWDMHAAGAANPTGADPSSEMAKEILLRNVSHSRDDASFLLSRALTSLPEIGTRFLNFRLIAEVGRGGFGRVYLARQGDLANRLVALKITLDLAGEEQKLAQLQHTNVVPVYSAHKAGALHAVCMPYFGSTTLADFVRANRSAATLPTSGRHFVDLLRARIADTNSKIHESPAAQNAAAADEALLEGAETGAATLRMLEKFDYVNAVLWLAEHIAEGLAHAHEHGILHGDLKPANILVTDDGQPMLLDFNLATDIKVHAALGELRVGGTLPYMAPEHLRALDGGDKQKVDARSDLYGLGVILFQLLTGRVPFETPKGPLAEILGGMITQRLQPAPRLRPHNPAVSPAVESIVRRCLDPDPDKRYQSARELQQDLTNQRQDFPLQHAPEPSMRERMQKWVRRHPRLTAPNNLIMAALFLVAAACAPFAWHSMQQWEADRKNLQAARSDIDRAKRKTEETRKELHSADARARGAEARFEALNLFREFHPSAAAARDLLDRVNLLRMRPEAWTLEKASLKAGAEHCRGFLKALGVLTRPDWQAEPSVALLPENERATLRGDVASLLHALAAVETLEAARLVNARHDAKPAKREIVWASTGFSKDAADARIRDHLTTGAELNAHALACFPASAAPRALILQQALLAQLAGDAEKADRLSARAGNLPLRDGTEDAFRVASALAAQNKLTEAEALAARTTRQFPDHFGAWRLRALCQQSLGDLRKAEAYWDTCAALKPEDSWVRFCRGQVCLLLRKYADAQKDFDAFLKAHQRFRDAHVLRAAAWEGQKRYPDAIADLTKALELGPPMPELYFRRAELKEKNNDRKGAEHDRLVLVAYKPVDLDGWIYRGMVQAQHNPKAALSDLEMALKIDQNNAVALYQKALILLDSSKRFTEAVGALNRLLIHHPDHVEGRLHRGLLHAKMGVRSKAIADAERALQHDVTPARCYQAACIYAFTLHDEPNDRRRAIELLTFALRNGYGADQFRIDPNLYPLQKDSPEYFRMLGFAVEFLDPAVSIRGVPVSQAP